MINFRFELREDTSDKVQETQLGHFSMLTPFQSEVVPEGSINPRHFMLKQVNKYI